MKHQRRPGSPFPYLLIAIASVAFAAAQPSFSSAPEANAVALTELAWTTASSQ